MLSEKGIRFLQEKISDIRTAILHNLSGAIVKLPTAIVNALKLDNEGQLWFLVNKPSYDMNIFDRQFPVRLDFYRKGYPFYLHVTGKAIIVDGNESNFYPITLDENNRKVATENFMLLKVAIQKAEYYERSEIKKETSHRPFLKTIKSWLHDLLYRPKNFVIFPEMNTATA